MKGWLIIFQLFWFSKGLIQSHDLLQLAKPKNHRTAEFGGFIGALMQTVVDAIQVVENKIEEGFDKVWINDVSAKKPAVIELWLQSGFEGVLPPGKLHIQFVTYVKGSVVQLDAGAQAEMNSVFHAMMDPSYRLCSEDSSEYHLTEDGQAIMTYIDALVGPFFDGQCTSSFEADFLIENLAWLENQIYKKEKGPGWLRNEVPKGILAYRRENSTRISQDSFQMAFLVDLTNSVPDTAMPSPPRPLVAKGPPKDLTDQNFASRRSFHAVRWDHILEKIFLLERRPALVAIMREITQARKNILTRITSHGSWPNVPWIALPQISHQEVCHAIKTAKGAVTDQRNRPAFRLNASQEKAIRGLRCRVESICGPPGSGMSRKMF